MTEKTGPFVQFYYKLLCCKGVRSLPVPEFWEYFFHSLPAPEFWEWFFSIPFPFPNFRNGIIHFRSVLERQEVIPAHPDYLLPIIATWPSQSPYVHAGLAPFSLQRAL